MRNRLGAIITAILLLLSGDPASAEEAAPRNFIPLPTVSGVRAQAVATGKPAKFFALTQPRFSAPGRDTKDMKIISKTGRLADDGQLPPEFAKAGTGNKTSMTQEQAQQIISIFASTR